jgi:hypothetical protein
MRLLKFIHSFLGIIPFIWLTCFLVMLLIGIIHFGYIPKEGNPVDPYKLGLDWLSVIITICSVCAYIAFYLWIALCVVLIIFFKGKELINRNTTILFIIGMSGFFIFKYLFSEVFRWVLD